MQKEIVEQPSAVSETIAAYLRQNRVCFPQINLSQTEICQFNQIRVIACGSAYHAGLAAKYILEALLQIPVEVDYASEFRYRSPIIDSHTLFVAISQSGETADTLAALRLANNRGIFTLAVVNVTGSSIAMESQSVLYTHAGPEIAVATTKAYSAQLVILYMLGLYFGEIRRTVTESQYNELIEALNALPKHIETVLQRERLLRDLAKQLAPLHDIYFMGRNLDYAVALEGALKLKEISYIHAEAYPAGELKHGTIALIEENSVVICVACVEEVLEKTIVNIQEVRARGAKVLVITTERNAARIRSECDAVFTVPDGNVLFSASLAVIPMQLLSYHIARLRGCEIDKPRNLAKSVTVE